MADAVLFGASLSPYVKKVELALRFKGVDYELVGPSAPSDFKKWNPQTQKMPVLEWQGERTFDSTFILRRLDQEVPEPPLFAADETIAARQRNLEDWSDESLYWYVMALRWMPHNAQASVDQILEGAPIPGLIKLFLARRLKKQLKGSTVAQGMGRLPPDVLVKELGRVLDDLTVMLGELPFFFGERVSAADMAVRGMLAAGTSGPSPEIERLLEERRGLVAWAGRVDEATGGAGEAGATNSE